MRACRRQQCGGAGSPVQHRVRGKHFGATYVSHHLISPLTGAPPASVPNMAACLHRPQLALNGSHVECGVSDLHHFFRNHKSGKPSYDTKRSERISQGGLCSRLAFGCFLCVVAFTSVEVSGGALEALSIAPPNASELPVREGVSAKQPVLQQVFPHSPPRDGTNTGTGGKSASVLSSQLNVLPSLAQKLKEHVVTPVAKAGKAVAAAAAAAAAATASLPGRAVALGGPGFIEVSAKVSALNDVFADADGAGLRSSREQRVLGRRNVGQASVDTARAAKILGMNEGSLRSSEPLDAAQERTNGSAAGKSNLKAGEPVVLSYDPPPTTPIPPDPPPPLPTLLFQNGQAPQQPVQPQQQSGSEPLPQRQEPLLGQLPRPPPQMLLHSEEVLMGTPSMAQEQERVQQQEQQQQEQQQQQSAVLHGVGGVTPVLLTNQQPVQQPIQLQMPMEAAPGSAGAPSSPLSVYGVPAGAASTASPVALTQQQSSGMPQFAPQPQQPVQQLQQLVQQPQQQLAEQQLSQQQVQQVALQHAQAPQPLMQQLTAVLQQPQQQLQQYAAQQQQLAAQQQAQQQAQALQQQQLAQQLQQQQQLPLVPVQVAMPAQPLQVLQGALQQQQQQQLQQLQQLQQQQQLLQQQRAGGTWQAPPVTVFSSPLQQPQQQMQQPQQQMQPQQQQMLPQVQQMQPQQQQGGALFATPLAPPGPAPSTPVTSCSLDTSSCQENAAAEEKAKKYAAQGVQCACQQLLLHLACSVMTKQSDLVAAEALKLDSPESSEATLQLRETACTALKTACPPISSLSLLATRVPSVPEQAAAAAAAATSASPVQLQLQEGAEAAEGAAGGSGVGGGKTQQQQQRATGGESGGAPPRELLGGTVLLQNATSEAAAAVGRAAASGAGTAAAGDAGAREAGEPGAGTAVGQVPPGIPSLLQEAAAAESHAAEGSQGRAPAPRDGEVAAAAGGAASEEAAGLAAGERAAATGERAATAVENEPSAVSAAEAATEEGRKEEEVANTASFAQQGSRNGAANQQQQVSSALSEARIALLHKAEEQRQVQQDAVAAIRDLVQQEPSSFVHGGAAVHSSNAEFLWVFATDAKEACKGVEGVLPIPLPVDAESDRHMLRLWIEGTEDSNKAIALHEEEKA